MTNEQIDEQVDEFFDEVINLCRLYAAGRDEIKIFGKNPLEALEDFDHKFDEIRNNLEELIEKIRE